MNKWVSLILKNLPMIILGVLLAFLMYWRWKVGLTRFFDVDEFSYLHWTADFARGSRPYTDFFMFFTPGFLWFFAPLVFLFPHGPMIFLAARVVSLGIFAVMLVLLGVLFASIRGRRWALLPVVLLAFLPMPYDKFLETRPDNLATLLAFGGLVFQVSALLGAKKSQALWFWSGMCYMASLVVFVKTLPFVLVGCAIAILDSVWGKGVPFGVWWKNLLRRKPDPDIRAFFVGLLIPLGVFLVWVSSLGDIGKVWYSLTKLPFEANMIGKLGLMEPHLFFFPNGSFYGGSATVTNGLILNHTLWFIGIIAGVVRFFTPFIAAAGDRRKALAELLIGGVFVLSVVLYVQFFPLKHSQYLIPIALFIAYYSSDAFVLGLQWINKTMGIIALGLVLIAGAYIIGKTTIEVNQVKLFWSNTVQLQQVALLVDSIPPQAEVLDLEGRMLFWRDPYYICCVPFGSFTRFLSRQPPVLRDVLEMKKVPYIYQGDSNRFSVLSYEDQLYIRKAYVPVTGWGETLWERIGI